MQQQRAIKVIGLMGLLAIGMALLAACTTGVPQSEYDAVKQQLAAKEKEAANLQQQLQAGGPQAAALQQQLAAKEQELAAAKAKAQNAVLSSNPNAKPRTPAPPPPPGATPAPPPQPPAARTVPMFFYVDTVTAAAGESKYNVDASLGCLRSSVFKRGQRIVWRMEVVDTSTGKVLQAADVQQVVLKLPNGETLNLGFGRHGRTDTSPWFWAVGWDIPLDFPLGSLVYTIDVVTKDGKMGTFKELTLETGFVQELQTTRPDPDKWKMTNAGLTIIE